MVITDSRSWAETKICGEYFMHWVLIGWPKESNLVGIKPGTADQCTAALRTFHLKLRRSLAEVAIFIAQFVLA